MRRIGAGAGSTRFIGRIAPRLRAPHRTRTRDDRAAHSPGLCQNVRIFPDRLATVRPPVATSFGRYSYDMVKVASPFTVPLLTGPVRT